ncbi:MAG: DUF2490 domain-containing protein [Muribaculaceae bacterium]|nr:DUF2490 domain-containing protein [Muribaculaceae bacterium]
MGRSKLTIIAVASFVLSALVLSQPVKADDSGLIVSAAAEKKFNKKTSTALEAELRTRNDFRTVDRIGVSLSWQYKINSWLKADAGYQLLIDNNPEKLTDKIDGTYNHWRPSYWATRHRAFASLTATYKIRRVSLSLRERYRMTYRPMHTTCRYDFDDEAWETTDVKKKTKHVLRSRFKVDWNIPASKFSPWASFELFNSMSLDKWRLQTGIDYSLTKKHSFELYYRYQNVRDDEETNTHYLGLGYKFKF